MTAPTIPELANECAHRDLYRFGGWLICGECGGTSKIEDTTDARLDRRKLISRTFSIPLIGNPPPGLREEHMMTRQACWELADEMMKQGLFRIIRKRKAMTLEVTVYFDPLLALWKSCQLPPEDEQTKAERGE